MLKRLICWWFGCAPDRESHYDLEYDGWMTPCTRCHAPDCLYSDMVGYTRHYRFIEFCRRWLLFGWVPRRCRDCGEYPSKCDCPPF